MLIDCRRRVLAFDVLNLGTAIENAPQSPLFEPPSKIAYFERRLSLPAKQPFQQRRSKKAHSVSLTKTAAGVNIVSTASRINAENI
jgi:hypothetical protein